MAKEAKEGKKHDSKKHLKVLSVAKSKAHEFRAEFRKQMTTAITAGLALVIALSWNDAIKEIVLAIVASLNIQASNLYLYKIYTAIIVTLICVTAMILFSRWGSRQESQ